MEFSVNHPIIFVMVAIILLAVLAQSVFFLWRAWSRAKKIGIDKGILRKTVITAIVFTIAPAISVLVGVVALSKSLGIALPWLRLSVIGSLSYETVAAGTTLGELGLGTGAAITNASDFVTVALTMTVGISAGLFLAPLLSKKIQGGIQALEKRDKKWTDILTNAMFLGMISAFLGYVFCDVSLAFSGDFTGLIPVCVMLFSSLVMALLGVLAIKLKQRWMTDYALPISLISGMAMAIPFTNWLS